MGTQVKVMWPEAKEYGQPLEARKCKEQILPLELPEGLQTWMLVP